MLYACDRCRNKLASGGSPRHLHPKKYIHHMAQVKHTLTKTSLCKDTIKKMLLTDLNSIIFHQGAIWLDVLHFDRKTGVPFHNFMTWQDCRAGDLVKSWNRSCTLKVSKLTRWSDPTVVPLTVQKAECWDPPLILADDPRSDEGCLLPDQTEAFPRSESHRLLHPTCHLTPCLGLNALQAGSQN